MRSGSSSASISALRSLPLLSEQVIRKVLFFQRELIGSQFLAQLLAPRLVGRTEPFPPSAGLGLAFACTLCPLLEPGEPLLQAGSSFGHLRVFHGYLGEPVVGVQSERSKIIFDHIFLSRPAVNVGLRKLDSINSGSLGRGHNGNKLRRLCFGRGRRRVYSASSGSGRASMVRRKSRMRATCKHSGSSG